jgi:hypothetical protein
MQSKERRLGGCFIPKELRGGLPNKCAGNLAVQPVCELQLFVMGAYAKLSVFRNFAEALVRYNERSLL